MKGLQNEAKDMASRGGPKGVNQNLKSLGSSPEDFVNGSLTNYRDSVIAPRMRQALTAQANANGAAGQANSMAGYLKHYVDQMYKSGGDLDIGGSPKANSPDLGPNGKPLPQPDAAHWRTSRRGWSIAGPRRAQDSQEHGLRHILVEVMRWLKLPNANLPERDKAHDRRGPGDRGAPAQTGGEQYQTPTFRGGPASPARQQWRVHDRRQPTQRLGHQLAYAAT